MQMMLRFLRGDETGYESLQTRLDELAPGYRERYATLAEIAAQNRLYHDAVRFARDGVARHPTFWRAHGLLGINRIRQGFVSAGRASLETAFRGDPFNVWIKNTLDLLDRVAEFTALHQGRFILVASERDAGSGSPGDRSRGRSTAVRARRAIRVTGGTGCDPSIGPTIEPLIESTSLPLFPCVGERASSPVESLTTRV